MKGRMGRPMFQWTLSDWSFMKQHEVTKRRVAKSKGTA